MKCVCVAVRVCGRCVAIPCSSSNTAAHDRVLIQVHNTPPCCSVLQHTSTHYIIPTPPTVPRHKIGYQYKCRTLLFSPSLFSLAVFPCSGLFTYMYPYVYTCTCTHVIFMHVDVYIYTHVHTCIYIYMFSPLYIYVQ